MEKQPARTPAAPLLCALLLGAACVYAASLLNAGVTPTLFVNFLLKPDKSMPLFLHNTGKYDIQLDVEGLEYFLFRPAGGGARRLLQIRSKPFGPDAAENNRRMLSMRELPPGASLETGELRPAIVRLPAGVPVSLTGVYAGLLTVTPPGSAWGGEVRSFPLTIGGGGK